MTSFKKFDINPKALNPADFTNDLTGEPIKGRDFEFYNEVAIDLILKVSKNITIFT